jgi:hypothetical protein
MKFEKPIRGGAKSSSVIIEFNGKKQTISEWALEFNIKYQTLYSRVFSRGWSISKSLGL